MRRLLLLMALAGSMAAGARARAADGASAAPEKLQPLEPDTAPFPPASKNDRYPEALNVTTTDGNGYAIAYGSGYVHAPLAKVLKALQDPEPLVDRRHVSEWTVVKGVEPYPISFRVHNIVHSLVTIDFDTTWRGAVLEGTMAAPKLVCLHDAKTAGTQYIHLIEGTIVAKPVDGHTTSLQIVRHLKGMMIGQGDAAQYAKDIYESIVAAAHGKPVPKFK